MIRETASLLLRGLQYAAARCANMEKPPLRGLARAPVTDVLRAHELAKHIAPDERVLDIGCGRAERGEALRRFVPITYVGIDLARPPASAEERFVVFDGEHVPFDDASFDTTLLCYVLHHLTPERAEALLGEAARVSRRRVILLEDSMPEWSSLYRLRNWLHRVESDIAYASRHNYRSPGGESMFLTHAEWCNFLQRAGRFRHVRVEPLAAVSNYSHHTLVEATL